jgi:pimeloyl-ACP methyl ester carboxylesterase
VTPLVLLHAFPLDSAMYDDVRGPLSEICTLVTPDFPGFAGTALPAGTPSLDLYADAVAAELDAQGIDRAVVGGTSMGGYTLMSFLRRHPDRVAGVALIDTKASEDPPEAAAGRHAMADRLERDGSADALVEAVFPKLLGTTTFAHRPQAVARVKAMVAAAPPASAAWAQRAMATRPDSLDVLGHVDVPTLVVVGAEDVLSPPSDAAEMAKAAGGAELVEIPEAGHLTPLEAPDAVASALSSFVRRISAAVG